MSIILVNQGARGGFPLPHKHCSFTRCGRFGICTLPFIFLRIREEKEKEKNPTHLPSLPPNGSPSLPLSLEAGSQA